MGTGEKKTLEGVGWRCDDDGGEGDNDSGTFTERKGGGDGRERQRYGFTSRCLRIFNTLLTHCESLDGNLSGLFITLIWLHNNPPYIYVHAHIHTHLK